MQFNSTCEILRLRVADALCAPALRRLDSRWLAPDRALFHDRENLLCAVAGDLDKGGRIENPDRPYGFTGDAGLPNGADDVLGSDIVVTAEAQKNSPSRPRPGVAKVCRGCTLLGESTPSPMRILGVRRRFQA